MNRTFHTADPGTVFGSLALLVLLSVGVGFLPLTGKVVDLLLLGIALLMTTLVAKRYMGIAKESHLVWWIVGVPLLLLLLVLLALTPDMVWRMNQPALPH